MSLDPRRDAALAASTDPTAALNARIAELERQIGNLVRGSLRGRAFAHVDGEVTLTSAGGPGPIVSFDGPTITLSILEPNRFLRVYADAETSIVDGGVGSTPEADVYLDDGGVDLGAGRLVIRPQGAQAYGAKQSLGELIVPALTPGTRTYTLRYQATNATPAKWRNRRLWLELA